MELRCRSLWLDVSPMMEMDETGDRALPEICTPFKPLL